MRDNIVDNYLNSVLKKQLERFHISRGAITPILDNIKVQLNSFLFHYHDIEFRNGLLILGSEEGNFYVPKNSMIANMVVLTIRNSLLEGISSKYYKEYGSSVDLKDNAIKVITSSAITYFASKNLDEYSKHIVIENDYYKEVASHYPVAMNALIELAKCSDLEVEHDYPSISYHQPYELVELSSPKNRSFIDDTVESGISPMFNQTLCHLLKGIKNKESQFFYTDCFKCVTRNFEKMLRILEFILTHDAFFITSNYFITKDYVSRRRMLVKASHSDSEMFEKLKDLTDVSNKYKDILQFIQDSYHLD